MLSLSTLAHQCISCSCIYQLPAQVMLVFWMCLSLCQTGSRETTCLASQAGAVIELGLVKQEKKKKKEKESKGLEYCFWGDYAKSRTHEVCHVTVNIWEACILFLGKYQIQAFPPSQQAREDLCSSTHMHGCMCTMCISVAGQNEENTMRSTVPAHQFADRWIS